MVERPPPTWGGGLWVFVKLVTDDGLEGVGECSWHARQNKMAAEMIKDKGSFGRHPEGPDDSGLQQPI